MDNDISISKKLQEIIEKEAFDLLDSFTASYNLHSLRNEEKILLAKLFIKKGELELKRGSVNFHESFALAESLAPSNATIYFLKGKVFASQKENARCLAAAIEAFAQAIAIDANFFEAYLMRAETLILSGLFHQNPYYFQKAQYKFQAGYALLENQPVEVKSHFFWKWGLSCYLMGLSSEEPIDFHQAIQRYRQAQQLGHQCADFWQDMAEALVELSELIKQHKYCEEAVEYYHLAVCEEPESSDRWLKLALCYEKLYELKGDLQHFELAQTAFEEASKGQEANFFLWLRWGKLYLNACKLQKNPTYNVACIEKFTKAAEIDPDHPLLLAFGGEAEMIFGIHTESLALLHSAEHKITRSLKLIPKNPHIWALYGACLNELGRYFSEESYYVQAVDKFQHGLTLQKQDPALWYGLATSYFYIGEYWNDSQQVENAVNCFQKACDLGGQSSFQFWNDWGLALMKLSELTNDKNYLEAAIQKFEKVINLQEEVFYHRHYEPEWLYNYGCALDFLGDFSEEVSHYEKAITVLNKALEMDPNFTNARYNLAVTLSHLGEATSDVDILHSAIEHFRVVLNIDIEDEMAWNDCGLAFLNIAELVHEEIRPERSKTYYQEAEQKFMHALALGCAHTFYNLACMHSLLQNYPSAMHYLERAEQAGTLPALEDMLNDEWLENLIDTPAFRQFISHIASKQNHLED
jgi:tetratricopeptide (TPR) repeat protein